MATNATNGVGRKQPGAYILAYELAHFNYSFWFNFQFKYSSFVTVVPPLYQLVLVAATEGTISHVIVTAADCDGRTTVTCAGNTTQTQSTHIQVLLLFVLHHLLVTRLYD